MSDNVVVGKEKMPSVLNTFVAGVRKGINLVFNVMLPNVIFAYALMYILEITGLTNIVGKVLSPIMGIFGLPGAAAIPLVLGYVSTSGGVASAAALYTTEVINSVQATIMLPFIFCTGALLQYLGRILAPSGIDSKDYKAMFLICTLNGVVSMIIMRVILMFML